MNIQPKRIAIRIAGTEQRTRRSVPALLCLIAGVIGLLSYLQAVELIAYNRWRVYLPIAALCTILWIFWPRHPFAFAGISLLAAGGLAIAPSRWHDILWAQVQLVIARLSGAVDAAGGDVTELALLLGLMFSLLLFILEFVLKAHTLPLFLTSVPLLLSPLLNVRISNGAIWLTAIFQLFFWVANLANAHRNQKKLTVKSRPVDQAAAAAGILLTAAFLLAGPLVSRHIQEIAAPIYEAEGTVYRLISRLSGQDNRLITGGQIGRGNNHRTGAVHLELTAPSQPAETLYLRGFSGEEYVGGVWKHMDKETVLDEPVLDFMYYEGSWENFISEFYFSISMLQERNKPASALALAIRHTSGNYEHFYAPYYSLPDIWYQWEEGETAGYAYLYYTQKDMRIQWERVSPEDTYIQDYNMTKWYKSNFPDKKTDGESRITIRDWFQGFRDFYMQKIQNDYTRVPTERLPRLTALVKENPLTDLDDITAFILYTLHSNTSYSLTPGWAVLNEDVVEYFLFEGKQGYCVHFASAATLMYRLYGIPARYATGYIVSPSDFMEQEDGIWSAAVTDEAAHAWVEIFLPDYGWTPIEVTPASNGTPATSYPGFDGLTLANRLRSHGWNMDTPSLQQEATTISTGQNHSNGMFPAFSIDWERYQNGLWAIAACLVYTLLLTPLFLDYRRLWKRRKRETMTCREIFGCLLAMLHDCGQFQDCDGTETDFSAKLGALLPELDKRNIDSLMQTVHAEAYGPPMKTPPENDTALKVYYAAARTLYGGLNRRERIVFRYGKAYD